MSAKAVTLERGKYGPLPADLLGSQVRQGAHRAALYAGLLGRHIALLRGTRSLTPDEFSLVTETLAQARFNAWALRSAPRGFFLVGADVAPYCRDVATLSFSAGNGRSFQLVQRARWLPLAEELSAASVPFERVVTVSPPIYVVHGKYGGEPIDGAFWSTRRALHFERGELCFELREVVGKGPGLSVLTRFAGSILAENRPGGCERQNC